MSLSPLAERIYQILVRQLCLPKPLISYGDLVRSLGRLPPPDAGLQANDPRLFHALEEISRACRSHSPPLPVLTSLVVRRTEDGRLGTPGQGYFVSVFPQIRQETARVQAWKDELRRVVTASSSYPAALASAPASPPAVPRAIPQWLREPAVIGALITALIGLVGTLLAVLIPIYLSNRRGEPAEPRPVARPVAAGVPQREEPPPQRPAEPRAEKTAPQVWTLDGILDDLERHHQRATFGAVAGVLGREPKSLFDGYRRTPRTAWVVSKSTGLPTGTSESDYPEGLRENSRVIDKAEDLRVWLRDHQ